MPNDNILNSHPSPGEAPFVNSDRDTVVILQRNKHNAHAVFVVRYSYFGNDVCTILSYHGKCFRIFSKGFAPCNRYAGYGNRSDCWKRKCNTASRFYIAYISCVASRWQNGMCTVQRPQIMFSSSVFRNVCFFSDNALCV